MEEIVIYGAGGLGKETILLINEFKDKYNLLGFYDDNKEKNSLVLDSYKVLGNIDDLIMINKKINVVCAIANPKIRKQIITKISINKNIIFPTLISKKSNVSKYVTCGKGTLIYSNVVATVQIELGDFNIIDVGCLIGHDVKLKNYITLYPGCNVSGNVKIDSYTQLGTGSIILQGLKIGENVFIGAGSVVTKDINESVIAVGIPAKTIKENK